MSVVGAPREGMIKPQLTGGQRVRATLGRMRPGPEHLVDAGFAVLVVALVLVGLRTSVFGTHSLLAGVVGVLIGLVLGHVQATYRWPLVAISALTVVLYLLVGALVVVRDDLRFGVLPTLRTFTDLAGAPIHGWKRWLTLVPPVDAGGQMLALVFFVAVVGTLVIYATARRHRSALLVAAPVLVLLCVVLLMGTQAPASPLVHGVALPVALLAWFALRARRGQERRGRPALSRLALGGGILAISALVSGLLGPLLGDADPSERSTLRAEVSPVHDLSYLTSPLGEFRSYTEQSPTRLWDTELFRVGGVPVGAPLRLATLDSWDGTTWGVTGLDEAGGDPRRAFQLFGQRVGVSDSAGRTPSEITVEVPEEGYDGPWVPTTGSVQGITLDEPTAERVDGKAWLNLSTDAVLVPSGLQAGDRYTLRTVLTESLGEELPQSLPVARGSLPMGASTDFVEPRLRAWAADESDPWRRFVAVATAMREEGTYTDGLPAISAEGSTSAAYRQRAAEALLVHGPGHGTARLTDFLGHDPLAGDDEQYAAALALMGNRLGIPTRVVLGAVATQDGVVRGRDVHAWVEVQRADRSWYPVMPQTFMPDRETVPPEQMKAWDAPASEPLPPPPPPPVVQSDPTDWSSPRTWPLWAKALAVLVGLPLLLLAIAPLVGGVRRVLRSRTGDPDQRVGRAWADLVDEARSMGLDVPLRATRPEQAMALGPQVDAMPVAVAADALVFGERPADPAAVGAWLRDLRAVRRRARRSAGLPAALVARTDPRRVVTHDVPADHAPRRSRRKADRT